MLICVPSKPIHIGLRRIVKTANENKNSSNAATSRRSYSNFTVYVKSTMLSSNIHQCFTRITCTLVRSRLWNDMQKSQISYYHRFHWMCFVREREKKEAQVPSLLFFFFFFTHISAIHTRALKKRRVEDSRCLNTIKHLLFLHGSSSVPTNVGLFRQLHNIFFFFFKPISVQWRDREECYRKMKRQLQKHLISIAREDDTFKRPYQLLSSLLWRKMREKKIEYAVLIVPFRNYTNHCYSDFFSPISHSRCRLSIIFIVKQQGNFRKREKKRVDRIYGA